MMKRIFDIILSVIGIVMLMPAFIVIAVLIKMDSSGPIFFIQERMGREGRIFRLLKFRTMVPENISRWQRVTAIGDTRVTSIGRFLRKYRIDEFPQLFNVIIGDMSLVGPRPELPVFIHYYQDEYKKILASRPGITDPYLSSNNNEYEDRYLNGETAEENYIHTILPRKIKVYLAYIKEQNLLFDLKVIRDTLYNTYCHKK
jgi:lipopolysaccharide/colanic/teichoic acid biosynthesis glycosyltransferase